MITKELLKKEIDKVQDKYFIALYKIIQTFESDDFNIDLKADTDKKNKAKRFIQDTYGSFGDSNIVREDQGNYDKREDFE